MVGREENVSFFLAPSDWNRLVISENILTQVCSVTEARSDHPSGVSANSQPNSLFPVPQLSHTGVLTGANQLGKIWFNSKNTLQYFI